MVLNACVTLSVPAGGAAEYLAVLGGVRQAKVRRGKRPRRLQLSVIPSAKG